MERKLQGFDTTQIKVSTVNEKQAQSIASFESKFIQGETWVILPQYAHSYEYEEGKTTNALIALVLKGSTPVGIRQFGVSQFKFTSFGSSDLKEDGLVLDVDKKSKSGKDIVDFDLSSKRQQFSKDINPMVSEKVGEDSYKLYCKQAFAVKVVSPKYFQILEWDEEGEIKRMEGTNSTKLLCKKHSSFQVLGEAQVEKLIAIADGCKEYQATIKGFLK